MVSAAGTGLSRVAGAVRDVVLSHVFGAGRASDAFWLAWTVPSIFRRFVADEGLTGALIPAVGQAEEAEGETGARRLANTALAALLLACAVVCVGGILGAPWLVKAFAWGFTRDPDKLALTVTLTRWLFPFVAFVSLVSYCEALLNYRGRFFIPKLAPGIVSGSIAAAALLLDHALRGARLLPGGGRPRRRAGAPAGLHPAPGAELGPAGAVASRGSTTRASGAWPARWARW